MQEKSKAGNPIYRYETKENKWTAPDYLPEEEMKVYEQFINDRIGKCATVYHEIVSTMIHIDVHIIEPDGKRDFYTLVTSGMSAKAMNVPDKFGHLKYAELMISLPKTWKLDEKSLKKDKYYWPIYWLKFLARFPHEYNTWLATGHTIPNGEPAAPFASTTKFCGMLLFPPVLFGETEMVCEVSAGKRIHLYTLHPLHESEMKFKLDNGLDALINIFDAFEVSEIIDTKREALI